MLFQGQLRFGFHFFSMPLKFFFFYPHLRTSFGCFLERAEGREKEINISVKEKHQLIAFLYLPQPGIELGTWICALTRNRTRRLLIYRMAPQPTEPHQPGLLLLLLLLFFFLNSFNR